MPWFKTDDGFANSRPVLRIPRRHRAAAVGVWTLAGTWCAKELTDGFVPDYALAELCGTAKHAEMLVEAGLWEVVDGGWRFVGWEKYQPTRAQVLEERQKEAERKRRWRDARRDKDIQAQSRPDGTDADVPDMSHGTDGDVPEGVPGVSRSSRPDPSRPDPVPKGTTETEPRQRDSRGHRLPDDWRPSEDVIAAMRAECPHVDLRAEHAKFADHWRSQPGAKGRKADWTATWRNWIRRAAESGPPRSRPHTDTAPGLTPREQEFLKAELMKDNPDPELLRRAGIDPTTRQKALTGGSP
ncbi:hypothetical protein [Nocardia otitidiscaviarum]|uniref:hypothetical protein n=1 Tax=Nocardia otitidiscaviarum TaxID=1823 RepID=UPI00069390FF|nr:hypothetical protein [Nocardia otitidiscaviarum]